jgi:two-component system cell cycle sensor histidine kinase/response regulator CckA
MDSNPILLVEDNPDDEALTLRAFRKNNVTNEVVVARDGVEALDYLFGTGAYTNRDVTVLPQVVILDLKLPKIDGLEVLRRIRATAPTKLVPVVILTSSNGEDIAVEAMREGAQDYVLKGNLPQLLPAMHRELVDAEIRREHRQSEQKLRQQEKFEAIGKLAGGIAHDFNNVIGAIMGWAEIGEEEVPADSRARALFGQIREQAERAGRLTQQLLAYARRQVLAPRNLNLNEIVGEATALLQGAIGAQIEVKTQLASDLRTTKADPAQMEQVLLNLCFNARDAMPQGGRLLIETRNVDLDEEYCRRSESITPGHYVSLSVSDEGVGMDAATIEKIFEPFFTTKEKGKGTGLGLATVFGIVKQHLGHIDVSSEIGKGSVFRVYLPSIEAASESLPEIEEALVRGGTETILLAEDHEGLREMSREVLSGLGYSIVLARDGREAIEKFEADSGKISLAVLDVVMPRLSGPGALERIRAINPSIPVIFTSGYSEESELLSSLVSRGAALLLQKPYSPKALARKIRDILDKNSQQGVISFSSPQ